MMGIMNSTEPPGTPESAYAPVTQATSAVTTAYLYQCRCASGCSPSHHAQTLHAMAPTIIDARAHSGDLLTPVKYGSRMALPPPTAAHRRMGSAAFRDAMSSAAASRRQRSSSERLASCVAWRAVADIDVSGVAWRAWSITRARRWAARARNATPNLVRLR